MRRNLHIALLITAALPLGCGSNPSPPTANYLDLTGNWEASAPPNPPNSSNFPTPIDAFIGALQSSGGTVTGTLRAFDLNFSSPCVSSTQDLAAAGTLDSTGNLVLTVPISGGTATISATLGSDLQTLTSGTWQIAGGSCAMASTAISITQFGPVTGTYTGTLTSSGGSPVSSPVTAVLTQSITPNADGQFPLSGTVTTTAVCPGTRALAPEVVTGASILNTGSIPFPSATVGGAFVPSGATIQAAVVGIDDLSCLLAPSLAGTLTRQ